jgi:hypothetical protein
MIDNPDIWIYLNTLNNAMQQNCNIFLFIILHRKKDKKGQEKDSKKKKKKDKTKSREKEKGWFIYSIRMIYGLLFR